MSCELVALTKVCGTPNIGGIRQAWVCDTTDIDEITLDAYGAVDTITMVATKKFYKATDLLEGNWNEVKASGRNAGAFTQKLMIKQNQIDQSGRDFADLLTKCCKLTLVAQLNSGQQVMMGFSAKYTLLGSEQQEGDTAYLDVNTSDSGTARTDQTSQDFVFMCLANEKSRLVTVDMSTLV